MDIPADAGGEIAHFFIEMAEFRLLLNGNQLPLIGGGKGLFRQADSFLRNFPSTVFRQDKKNAEKIENDLLPKKYLKKILEVYYCVLSGGKL